MKIGWIEIDSNARAGDVIKIKFNHSGVVQVMVVG